MTQCPHPDALQVGGRCYWCCKVAALNGHRSKLTEEQRQFCGVGTAPQPTRWTQPSNHDHQHDSLMELLDTAPGWFALARKILEPR